MKKRLAKCLAVGLTVFSMMGLCSIRGPSEVKAAGLPDHIVNGDFQYAKDYPWEQCKGIANGEAKWMYIVPSNGRGYTDYNDFALSKFKAEDFGWKSNQPAMGRFPAGAVEIQKSNDGQVYAEIIGEDGNYAIYQDIAAQGDSILYWRLKHAPRGASYTGGDEIHVKIGPPGKEVIQTATRTTNNGSGDKVGEKMQLIHTSKPNNTKFAPWETYEGRYLVAGTGDKTIRFTFQAGAVGSTGRSGNLLDDVVFTAAYPIDFDSNGGVDIGYNPKTSDYAGYFESGRTVTLSNLTTKKPTRAGYTFLGWSTKKLSVLTSEGAYTSNKADIVSSVKTKSSSTTLYAVWGKNPKMTFVDRGTTVKDVTVAFGGTTTAPTNPTRTGYTFSKWSPVIPSKVYSNWTTNAVWSPNTYTLTYKKNNPSGASVGETNITLSKESQSAKYDATWGTLATASKPGYTFNGWYTAASGGTKISKDTIVKGNQTVYAHWTPKVYTLTYKKNNPPGASIGESNVVLSKASQTGKFDAGWGTLATASKPGYTFDGWYTAASGGTKITADTTVKGDLIGYAHWTPNIYTLTYEKNNPSGASANDIVLSKTSQTGTYDKPWGTLATATKVGYTFQGWYTATSGGTKVTSATLVTGNKTVYAQWKPVEYVIRFHGNQENRPGHVTGSMASVTIPYDKLTKLPKNQYQKTIQIPAEDEAGSLVTKESSFVGWGLSPTSLTSGYKDEAQVMNLAKEQGAVIDFYAIWDDAPEFVIEEFPNRYFTLDEAKNGVITESELLSTVKVYDRETQELPKKTQADVSASGSDVGVTLVDYDSNEFMTLDDDAIISVRYQVKDDAGHIAYLYIRVFVTANGPNPEEQVSYYRSISDDYYQNGAVSAENGGLSDHSIWREDAMYAGKLKNSLADSGLVEYFLYLDDAKMAEIKDYIQEFGFGNAENPDALADLFDSLR